MFKVVKDFAWCPSGDGFTIVEVKAGDEGDFSPHNEGLAAEGYLAASGGKKKSAPVEPVAEPAA